MTQNQINREVAHATGESVERIRRLGFNAVVVPHAQHKPRRGGALNRAKRAKRSKPVGL